ncbi:CDP-diacylglycerol--glycerol-3-phosphate 3-phosphatidyltransferase [Aliagarivorans taiwanensis]|uniref:CDP-diacylglycerol--glycerol-3-phosphate 3-phosphatidyltransferase n=1 Tax=Aliagarivorans taiwanensis TaxID=561966 RepID=UPI0003F55872|nr:CDP-diacylglycerol--glycerol-3-phosphate 3-phosphatidyltransferase [Aliagarivorans taiwanensis]
MNNIPNILTLFRVVLIPFFLIAFYLPVEWAYIAAALIFSLAAITDYLDGYLARKLEQSTPFGAFLDPVADKVMVVTALVVLVHHYQDLWVTIPAVVMVAREVIISALREWMAELGKRSTVAVSNIGKYKTTFQMISLIVLIAQLHPMLHIVGMVSLWLATGLTLWSMVVYLRAAWPVLMR